MYELTESDAVAGTELYGLDPLALRRAVQVLVKRGQAQFVKGSDGEVAGMKFFAST